MINKLFIWCQKVTPLVYDNSLSYYESLCKIVQKVNDLIEAINSDTTDFQNYVDEQIQNLKNYTDGELQNQYNTIISETENIINNLENDYEDLLNDFTNQIQNYIKLFETNTNNKIEDLYYYINLEIIQLRKDIEDMLKDYDGICFNPTNGLMENPCKVLNDIYENLRYNAFTALEFDTSNITAGRFDESKITCKQYDINGKVYFHKKYCECVIRNPFTGLITSVQKAFDDMIATIGSGITAIYFDNLNLTASTYDEKQITAYSFSFEKNVL